MKGAAIVIALGSNLGHPLQQVEAAVRALRADPDVLVERVSPWYRTAPVGGPADQPAYTNGVLSGRTRLAPEGLLVRLQELERNQGRDRGREVENGPRPLDLDLLFYGARRIERPELTVPHPRLAERAFVLAPLADIDPERRLACGRSVRERLSELDRSGVERLSA